MVTMSDTLISSPLENVFGLVASLKPANWRLAPWVTAAMVTVFAVAGLLAPSAASDPGLLRHLEAIGWAVAFIGAAEMKRGLANSTACGSLAAA